MAAVSRRHRSALTRVLRATGLANIPEEAMLVELLRDLAKRMDEGPTTRDEQAYLSAQKDLRRVLNGYAGARVTPPRGREKPAEPEPDEELPVVPAPNDLTRFKQEHGIAS